jgi:hypothetical protein
VGGAAAADALGVALAVAQRERLENAVARAR